MQQNGWGGVFYLCVLVLGEAKGMRIVLLKTSYISCLFLYKNLISGKRGERQDDQGELCLGLVCMHPFLVPVFSTGSTAEWGRTFGICTCIFCCLQFTMWLQFIFRLICLLLWWEAQKRWRLGTKWWEHGNILGVWFKVSQKNGTCSLTHIDCCGRLCIGAVSRFMQLL